jgi:type IV pilus biogenesis protein CpaD/CtpE
MGPSLVAQHMGEAIHTNIAQQTENPNAAYDNTETPRIDPDTAAIMMDRYYEKQSRQAAEQPPSIIQINAN